MRKFNKNSILAVSAISFALVLMGPIAVYAAGTAPSLGAAAGYSVYGDAGITNSGAGTHLWGNVGDNNLGHPGLVASQVDGTISAGAGVNAAAATAYGALDAQGSDGAKNLSTPQTVTPGVYTLSAAQTLTGAITLSGAGVYIFRSDSAYTVANSASVVLTNGATACNVFWEIPTSMTIGTNAAMIGTIITNTGLISLNTGATLQGRAFAHTQVTLLTNQITDPTCAAAPASGGASQTPDGTINVVKLVINDNGGTKTVADFPLFVNGMPVVSGVTNSFGGSQTYTVTETTNSKYTQTFSGDCTFDGRVALNKGDNRFCILTNDDIGAPVIVPPVPPLIDVVKVPSPLALPAGPGPVTYTYTLRNIGTVPVTNVTMVGDSCSPITLVSGDTNNDSKLDVNETWTYRCSTTLSATHTNTVVATGWANGISATDIASATVVVGAPVTPPLIHVTKIPTPLTLLAGGGAVTYTQKVTNPGMVPLSNVRLTDNKCSPVTYISGDTNADSKLDVSETWIYTCKANLTQTTTNTVVATGDANGLTAKDFAIATVVVAQVAPALPNTGFPPQAENADIVILMSIFMVASVSFLAVLKKRTI